MLMGVNHERKQKVFKKVVISFCLCAFYISFIKFFSDILVYSNDEILDTKAKFLTELKQMGMPGVLKECSIEKGNKFFREKSKIYVIFKNDKKINVLEYYIKEGKENGWSIKENTNEKLVMNKLDYEFTLSQYGDYNFCILLRYKTK